MVVFFPGPSWQPWRSSSCVSSSWSSWSSWFSAAFTSTALGQWCWLWLCTSLTNTQGTQNQTCGDTLLGQFFPTSVDAFCARSCWTAGPHETWPTPCMKCHHIFSYTIQKWFLTCLDMFSRNDASDDLPPTPTGASARNAAPGAAPGGGRTMNTHR